ncbi:RNA-binding S4 domain-containing protein [Thaumasiovibrio sp. DFM-14]|uniref:RNA-binding S4 domain-containing protein n=1 Tax=Thaumasiovibrio sp. DFM-14 TaxID=3384792 RepID=UPI0039A25D7C
MHEEIIEVEAEPIVVDSLPIELYKALKIANVVSGGGEAKFVIAEGYVAVNGELEQRKRRKLNDGDVIEFNGEFYVVDYQEKSVEALEAEAAIKAQQEALKSTVSKPKAKKKNGPSTEQKKTKRDKRDSTTGRKSISF